MEKNIIKVKKIDNGFLIKTIEYDHDKLPIEKIEAFCYPEECETDVFQLKECKMLQLFLYRILALLGHDYSKYHKYNITINIESDTGEIIEDSNI